MLYDKSSEPKTHKVVIGLAIALVLIPVVVVSCISNELGRAFGGGHTATDRTVAAARTKAKPTAENEVQRLLTVLVPVLGTPVRKALVDGCSASDVENYVSSKMPATARTFCTPPPLQNLVWRR